LGSFAHNHIVHPALYVLDKLPPFTHGLLKPNSPWWQWLLGIIGDFLLIGGVLFFLLWLVPSRWRKGFIAILTFLAGLIYSVEFFMPGNLKDHTNILTGLVQQIGKATNVVYAFALGLGVYSLLRFHGSALARKRPGWHNNLAFFIAFALMLFAGFWSVSKPSDASKNFFDMLFRGVVAALGSTMFSTIGFFIVSAAYRAFRIRSGEATLMLAAAFVVMLGQVPIGAYMTSSLPATGLVSNLRLENLSYWILNKPNMAAWRGMSFGIEIGALAMALRTWLSLERGSFFDKEL
jgi:hypothetical protein